MPVYKPSELMQFLQGLGISPKKALSQNFLIDGNIIRKIVAAAEVVPGDLVFEIGPGPGSLSEALLEAGATVVAVEKDKILAQALERFQTPNSNLEIICDDILNVNIASILQKYENRKAKIIANLPYNITTPILSHLLPMHEHFSSCTVMVQEEVARRFTAIPGTRDYSSFTIFLRFFSDPHYAFTVSRNCFYPVPGVDSAVVKLNLKLSPAVSNRDKFFQTTRRAFEHRRKMLKASLRDLYPQDKIMEALSAITQNPFSRPEELSLEQFLDLFERLN
jgi:16S rRNA (adenine1518-N6/adenine1519-N6)-dimethyltransferase